MSTVAGVGPDRKAARRALDQAREALAAGQSGAAGAAVARALAHDPGWAGAHAFAGRLALKSGDLPAAEAAFRAAIACDGADHAVWCGLATALRGQGRGDEVAALLAPALGDALAGAAPWRPATARLAFLWLDHAAPGATADAVLERLAASAPHLHETQLAALLARLPAGSDAMAPVLTALLACEGLRPGSVMAAIRALRDRADVALVRRFGARLLARVAPGERDMAAVGVADLIDGAVAAAAILRTRDRRRVAWHAPQRRQAASVLRRAGEASLAARWLRRACRGAPGDAGLAEEWLRCSADCGRAGEALDRLAGAVALAPARRAGIEAELLVRTGQQEAALALLEAGAAQHGATFAARERLDLALGLGRLEVALACRAALLADSAGSRLAAQFSATLPGFLLTDLRLGAAEPVVDARRFFAPAAAALRALPMWSGDGQPGIAVSVAQYWDDDTVPDEVAVLAASWASVPGCSHRLFTRAEAQDEIFDTLGPASADAFGAAFHGLERADFFLLCHLLGHGGIVADPASRRCAPMAALIGGGAGLVAAMGRRGEVSTAVIAARAGHPAIALAHDRARRGLAARSRLASWLKTGAGMLTMEVAAWADSLAGLGETPDLRLLSDQQMARIAQTGLPLASRLSAARREALAGQGGGAQDRDGDEKADARALAAALASAGVNIAGANDPR